MRAYIQWDKAVYWDKPYNPMIGCEKISPACENCYAKAWADRFDQCFTPHFSTKHPPRKGVVFCGNMTDLFGDWNYIRSGRGYYHRAMDFIAETIGYKTANPYKDKATYLWLTKRVQNMAECVAEGGWEYGKDYWSGDAEVEEFGDCDMSNHYFGFTAENQEWYDKRIEIWRSMAPSWVNGWLSAEPLLGSIDLGLRYIAPEDQPFSWVVVGCESGSKRRPCKIEWVEHLVAECLGSGIPVFVKQLDINGKCETDISKFPEHLQIRQVPWKKPDELVS